MSKQEPISVRVLLVSHHVQTIETLSHFLERMAVHVEPCCDLDTALRKLCRGKFEAVIVDLAEKKEEALELLRRLRQLTSNKGAVACAVLKHPSDKAEAFQAGANFVLERPLAATSVARTFRAAYPLMVRERRRYFRCPLQTQVYITQGSEPETLARSVNISEGGMAVSSPVALHVGDKIQVRFQLSGQSEFVTLAAEVCWVDGSGLAGIQFLAVSAKVSEQLQSWLAQRLQEVLPLAALA